MTAAPQWVQLPAADMPKVRPGQAWRVVGFPFEVRCLVGAPLLYFPLRELAAAGDRVVVHALTCIDPALWILGDAVASQHFEALSRAEREARYGQLVVTWSHG